MAEAEIDLDAKADFSREAALIAQGFGPVAGIDEVGRGPLAGPVVVAAVILDPRRLPKGLADSKALKPERRESLFEEIMALATAVSVASLPARTIDQINIRQATLEAMRRACLGLAVKPQSLLIDGNDCPAKLPCPAHTVIKGDASVLSIAAASIVAKVTRDRLMARLADHFPVYGFHSHVGYGTPQHLDALRLHGPSPLHRLSFAPCNGSVLVATEAD